MTAPKELSSLPPDPFAPGSWDEIQRDVGWRPCAETETKKQPAEDVNEKELMEMIRQLDELRALEKKTAELNRRAKTWKKWTL